MENQINLSDEYDRIWQKIKNGDNFALLRYGDGERALMCSQSITAQEGWSSSSELSSLGKSLLNTLDVVNENFIYAISCPCCDRKSYYWYSTNIESKNKTFANLFINKNYQRFIQDFETLKRDAIFIGNYRGKDSKIGNLNILKYYTISDNCIEFWEKEGKNLIKSIIDDYGMQNNLLYVISAGPISEPIIKELFLNNPNNCYIDFGSAIDKYIHKTKTRPYENPKSKYGKRNCWMYNPKTTNFDVSVILTLYKRPQNLEIQLQAIKGQSLKPKEILLYQDGTGETVKIPENIKNEFDLIEISPENKGVWERFRFALKNAKSEYVCVFDDDTIPGSRWFENCHSNMMEEDGIYGTNGILMNKPGQYPFDGFVRLGWFGPVKKSKKVDFVGHSWFFPKKVLEYMFDNTEKYQAYKYVGEDMGISFMAKQKLGLSTFVPPHPIKNKDLWGSLPEYAKIMGTDDSAVHINSDNINQMNSVLKEYLEKDYIPLSKTDKYYVLKMCFFKKLAKELTRYLPNKEFRHNARAKLTEFFYSK